MIFSKGKEIAESAKQQVNPGNNLEVGQLVKEYQQNPQDVQVRGDIRVNEIGVIEPILPPEFWRKNSFERKKGKVLDENVLTGK